MGMYWNISFDFEIDHADCSSDRNSGGFSMMMLSVSSALGFEKRLHQGQVCDLDFPNQSIACPASIVV